MIKKLEIFSWFVFGIGFLMRLALLPLSGFLITVSLSVLSILYFVGAYFLFSKAKNEANQLPQPTSSTLGIVGAGVGLGAVLVGIMFSVQLWPGAKEMLGGTLVVILLILGLLFSLKNTPSRYDVSKAIRTSVIVGALGLVLYITPASALVDIYYRHHPEYAKALKDYLEDPHNEAKTERLNVEFQKAYPASVAAQD